jgi:hypothetical protein
LHHIIDDKTNDIMNQGTKGYVPTLVTPVAAATAAAAARQLFLVYKWMAMAMKSFRLEGMSGRKTSSASEMQLASLSSDESDDGLHGPEMIMVSLRPKAVLIPSPVVTTKASDAVGEANAAAAAAAAATSTDDDDDD